MMRQLFIGALGLVLAAPVLNAQDGIARLENRARIGVMVQSGTNGSEELRGALIVSVVEDGPADDAGLRRGDIITSFNGTSLAGESDGDSPGERLVELAEDLEPGDEVELEYLRGDESGKATVTAEVIEGGAYAFSFGNGGEFHVAPFAMERAERALARVRPSISSVFTMHRGGLDLQDMNPGLGEYFGTSEGALIVSTPDDSASALRAGDVILSIDGREVNSAGHASRILASYEDGETARIEIMRKQERMTVDWSANRDHGAAWMRAPGERMRMLKKLERT